MSTAKNPPFLQKADTAIIRAEASTHADFFSSIYIFTDQGKYEEINFWFDRDNQATIIPKAWSTSSQIDAHFTVGNLLQHLPNDYSIYRVTFLQHANVTPQDVDTIFSWQSASDIKAYDESGESDITLMLWHRVFEFKTKKLNTLSLLLQSRSINEIDATAFFDNIGSLKTFYLYVTLDVRDGDLDAFIEQQKANKYLSVAFEGDNVIKLTRKSSWQSVLVGASNMFGKWGS